MSDEIREEQPQDRGVKLALQVHRSITFWAGILAMGFIVWAWRDSMTYSSSAFLGKLGFHHSQGYVSASHAPGRVQWDVARMKTLALYAPEPLPQPFIVRGEGADKILTPTGRETYRAAAYRTWRIFDRKAWRASVPHWLLLLAVAVLWGGLLGWRVRRRRRMNAG